ncbi:hypothetical protein [Sulfurimonas sp. NW9]|uniref:hypothetical protein n=1 Tax=Sulfurimonas sp. NW9 TaxID=2922728 RepID=UPI003DA9CA6F
MSIKKINILRDMFLESKPNATAKEVAHFIKDIEMCIKLSNLKTKKIPSGL